MHSDLSTELYRIVLVDDHQLVHDAVNAVLRSVRDIRLVGAVYRGEDAVALISTTRPDLVLMDVVLPGMDGAATTRAVLAAHPQTKVLVLSSFTAYEHIRVMLDSGATGYLVKDVIAIDLVDTIRQTCRGNTVFSPEVARTVLAPAAQLPTDDFLLTGREREVLDHLARGETNAQIAAYLEISQPTVRYHLNNILMKFKVQTRSEALILAAKHHFV